MGLETTGGCFQGIVCDVITLLGDARVKLGSKYICRGFKAILGDHNTLLGDVRFDRVVQKD